MALPETTKAAAALAASDLRVVADDPAGTRSLNHLIPASLAPASLSDEHWALPLPSDAELEKLCGLGVDEAALWSPWPLRAANVIFHEHLFDFAENGEGQRAFILRCDDAGNCSDLVAWRGDKLATHHGVGFCLGDRDQIHNPATCALRGRLRIHRTVPDWLKAGRDGIVILRPSWAYGELKNVPAIAVANETHGLELLRLLEPPKLTARNFYRRRPRSESGSGGARMTDRVVPFPPRDRLHKLPTISARDLQAMDFSDLAFVIAGYVVEGLTLLVGKPKLGKSWLALDWALAVAYGGLACGSITCETGDVLYCALEDNQRRLKRRMHQLLPNTAWPDRLELMTTLRRLDQGGIDDLKAWILSVERPRLTFARVRPRKNAKDGSYDADYAGLIPLHALASEFGIAIVVIHHVSKRESDDPLDLASGTTGMTGAPDTILIITRDGQGVTLYGRGRDIDDLETAMQFDGTTGRWAVLGAAVEIRLSEARKNILGALKTSTEPMSPKAIADALAVPLNNVNQLLPKMVAAGEISKGVTRSVRTPPTYR